VKPHELTLVLLAGNPKCLETAQDGRTYLEIGLNIGQELPFAAVVVVSDMVPPSEDYVIAKPGETLYDSLSSGLSLVTTEYALALATDLMSTPLAVADFCRQVGKCPEAPFYCGVSQLEECRRIKPGIRSHFICKYGKIRFASAYVIKQDWLEGAEGYARAVFDHRKNIPKVVWHVLRFFTSELFMSLLSWSKPQLPRLVLASPDLAVDYDSPATHMD
jgi:hypothetical protein